MRVKEYQKVQWRNTNAMRSGMKETIRILHCVNIAML